MVFCVWWLIYHDRRADGIGVVKRLDRIVRGIDTAVRTQIQIQVTAKALGLPRGVMQTVGIPQKWNPILDR